MKNVNHIVWADLIRVIAILMVICIHCSDPFNVSPEARLNPEYNLWGSIYGAFLRPCVPLFVMLTGMLLLPVEQEIGQFYKKRMLRVIVPFIVWSLLYLKSATKPLNVLIAFTRPLITEFADNLNLKHPLLPTISPYPTM